MEPKVIEILLVEDNPGDVELTREGLRTTAIPSRLSSVENGIEALAWLRREEGYAEAPRPDLILLDLNLPRMDGRELLAELKQDPAFRRIPVIVLTSSDAERDVLMTYDLHANCYLIKPVGFQKFLDVVRRIEDFWLAAARLPSEASIQ